MYSVLIKNYVCLMKHYLFIISLYITLKFADTTNADINIICLKKSVPSKISRHVTMLDNV
jgi:hypothetical protein